MVRTGSLLHKNSWSEKWLLWSGPVYLRMVGAIPYFLINTAQNPSIATKNTRAEILLSDLCTGFHIRRKYQKSLSPASISRFMLFFSSDKRLLLPEPTPARTEEIRLPMPSASHPRYLPLLHSSYLPWWYWRRRKYSFPVSDQPECHRWT